MTEKEKERDGRAVPWKKVQEVLADLKTIYDDEKIYKIIEKLRRKTHGEKIKLSQYCVDNIEGNTMSNVHLLIQ